MLDKNVETEETQTNKKLRVKEIMKSAIHLNCANALAIAK